jgi:hypothetical protein
MASGSSQALKRVDLFPGQASHGSECPGRQQDAGALLQAFHPDPRYAQVGAPGERPVIGQQHGVMSRDERLDGVAQRVRPGRPVGRQRYLAHQQRDLG